MRGPDPVTRFVLSLRNWRRYLVRTVPAVSPAKKEEENKIDAFRGIHSAPSRRGFLGYLGISPGLTGLAGAGLLGALQAPRAFADDGPLNPAQRGPRAFVIRR